MIDFNPVIKKAIDSIPAVKNNKAIIVYGFPKKWDKFPILCYTSGSKTRVATDISRKYGARQYQIQYYIDIWTQGELGTLYELQLIEALDKAGFKTSSLGDIVDDPEKDRHHIRLSTIALYDVKNNTLY